jgi:hypothetical protein
MDVIIHTFDKNRYIINIDESDLVMVILVKLKDLINIDIENSKLVYSGILLNPNNTIGSYGIKNNENIHLI